MSSPPKGMSGVTAQNYMAPLNESLYGSGSQNGGYTPQTQGWQGIGGMSSSAEALPPQAQSEFQMPPQAQGAPQGVPVQGMPTQGMPPQAAATGQPPTAPTLQQPQGDRNYLQGMVPQEFYQPQGNFQATPFRTPEELMNKDALQSWRSSMYPGGEKPRRGGPSNDPFWKMREQAKQMRRGDQDAYHDEQREYKSAMRDYEKAQERRR
jgi:hypothetical protein